MAVALLVPALAAPVTAADRQIRHGNVACMDSSFVDGLVSGQISPSGWASQTGAFASIDFHYDACGDNDSAVAAWVALVPDNTTGQIIQVGIIACGGDPGSSFPVDHICHKFPNQLRYFAAAGGCNLAQGAYPIDLGAANAGYHSYKVSRKTEGWYLTAPTGTYFVSATNSAVSCIGSSIQTSTQFGVEKYDRGDSSGGSTTSTTFNNMEHYTAAGGWQFFTSASGVCQRVMSTAPHTSFCAKAGDGMNAWD